MRSWGCQETANPYVTTIFGDLAFLTLRAREAYTRTRGSPHVPCVSDARARRPGARLVPPGRQAPASRPASEARTQTVYATVLGPKNAPVTGLSAADFSVREDNAPREVLKAEIATDPMQVVLIVDDSQASTDALQPLREGLNAFVDKLNGHGEIGIVTSGDRATSLVGTTTSAAALKAGINRIFARPGAGAYLLDAVMDVSQGFQRRRNIAVVCRVAYVLGLHFFVSLELHDEPPRATCLIGWLQFCLSHAVFPSGKQGSPGRRFHEYLVWG